MGDFSLANELNADLVLSFESKLSFGDRRSFSEEEDADELSSKGRRASFAMCERRPALNIFDTLLFRRFSFVENVCNFINRFYQILSRFQIYFLLIF